MTVSHTLLNAQHTTTTLSINRTPSSLGVIKSIGSVPLKKYTLIQQHAQHEYVHYKYTWSAQHQCL